MAVDVVDYEIGEVQTHGNLAVAPVYGKSSDLDYIVFRDAMNNGLEVKENPKGVQQNEIYVENKTGRRVLAITGEIVKGIGQNLTQNRNFVRNVYFDERFGDLVPVNCAERGQPTMGGSGFGVYGGIAPTSISSLNQGEAWDTIVNLMGETALDVKSRTADFSQVYEDRKPDFEDFSENFSRSEGQVGFVVGFRKGDKMLYGLDMFDSAKTFESYYQGRLWSHIVESGFNDKLEVDMSKDDAREFLEKLGSCDYRPITPVSIGEDFKIRGEGVLGSCIKYDGIAVYTNLFSSDRDELPERVASHREIDSQETRLYVEPMESDETVIGFDPSNSGPNESFDDETVIR